MPSRERSPAGKEVAYDINRLLERGVPLLEALERQGRTSFDVESEFFSLPMNSPLRPIYKGLLSLGVTIGSSITPPAGEPGRITLGMTYSSTGYGKPLVDVVLNECEPGNLRKLRQPVGARASHLGVVVEPSVGRAYVALREGKPGEAPASLPDPITTLWAMADRYVASVTPPDGWVVRAISDATIFDQPERWRCAGC